jgi:hypothetical protein
MALYKNYLQNNQFSSFSQLNIDPIFYKNILILIIESLYKHDKNQGSDHLGYEFSTTTFINALLGYSQNVGTQILERNLYSILKNDIKKIYKENTNTPSPFANE